MSWNNVLNFFRRIPDATTEIRENVSHLNMIHKYFLPKGEYYSGPTKKYYIFLHHTAGWENPYRTVNSWANDNRGRIATHYVIGGINPVTGNDEHDGVIVQTMPEDAYAWHLGKVNRYMHTHSIGIELCNMGFAEKVGNDFYTYTGKKIDKKFVIDLGYKFRGYRYWISYSDRQLLSLEWLLNHLLLNHPIPIKSGIPKWLKDVHPYHAFEYNEMAKNGKILGILSHSNVAKHKYDVYPHPKLCAILKSLV